MSYVKQTWQTGDTVTSAKLNHMEDGIAAGGGVLVVGLDTTTYALDKTWQEIHDAIENGQIPIVITSAGGQGVVFQLATTALEADHSVQVFQFAVASGQAQMVGSIFAADSADGYPVMQTG